MRDPTGHPGRNIARLVAFAVVLALCVLGGAAYVLVAALSGEGTVSDARVAEVRAASALPEAVRGRRVLVRAVDAEDPGLDGRVTAVRLGRSSRRTGLSCQRVHMAAGRGVCLALAGTGLDYAAVIFDRRFRPVHTLALDGLPSRVRVSSDGRLASVTSFVTGHSYAESGEFSTSTRLLDLHRGRWIAELEDFRVFRDGQRIESPDFNFWGVTFERGGRSFYATLSTGPHRYLVHGTLRDSRVDIVRDHVECPSLSPDGTRIAYKRTLGEGRWRPHVLDLRTGADRALAETRSIDDQIEWLGDGSVLYGDGSDVLMTPADGGGRPRRILARAASPVSLD